MQFGLCTISNRDARVETVLDQAATAGYDGVEIWGKDHAGTTQADCRAIRRDAADRGLEVPVYGSYLRAGTDGFEAELERELDRAASLNAGLIRVWAGEQEYDDIDRDHWNRVCEDLQRASTAAEDRGVGVTVEKHEGTVTNDGDGAQRLIEAVDADNCGLNWQPLFSLSAETLREEAATLAPLCNNVHLQAVAESGETNRCALSESYFDLKTILEAFQTAGFEGFANVEFVSSERDYEAAIAADLRFLRQSL